MIKVAQAMDTIAMHACPTCLDEDFGFGLTASTDWEVWQLKPVPPHPFPAPQPQQQQPWPWPVARSPMSLALSPHAPRPKQVELKLVDDRIIAINSAIAATAVGTPPQVRCLPSPPPLQPPYHHSTTITTTTKRTAHTRTGRSHPCQPATLPPRCTPHRRWAAGCP